MREVDDGELKVIHTKLLELLCAFRDICDREEIFYSLCAGTMLGAVRHNGFIPWDTDADVMIWLPDKERFREAFGRNKPEGIALKNHNAEPKCLQSHDTLYFEEEQIVEGIHLDIYPMVGAPSEHGEQARFSKYTHIADKIIRSKYKKIKNCRKKNRLPVAVVKAFDHLIPDSILRKNIYNRETKYNFESSDHIILLSNYGRREECMPKSIWDKMIHHEFEGQLFKIPSEWDTYLTRIYGDYMTPKKY